MFHPHILQAPAHAPNAVATTREMLQHRRVLLLVAAAAAGVWCQNTVPPSPEGLARCTRLRGEAVQRWERERATDYLQDAIFTEFPERQDLVRHVCDAVADEEERWMCGKRGAHLARRMRMYKSFSGADIDKLSHPYHRKDNSGMRFHVVNGSIYGYEMINGFDDQNGLYASAALGKVVEGLKGKILRPDMTFDFVILFTDESICHTDPAATSTIGKPPPGYPAFPVLHHAVAFDNCPYFISMPFIGIVQRFPKPPTDAEIRPVSSLEYSIVYRGMYYNVQRLHLALMTVAGQVDKLDAKCIGNPVFGRPRDYQPTGSVTLCSQYLGQTFEPTQTSRLALSRVLTEKHGGDAVCSRRMGGIFGNYISFEVMRDKRYVLAVDGVGAVERFPHLLASSSVVLGLQIRYRTYFFPDLIPFVHYVPVTDDLETMQQNLTDTVAWLEAHPEVAQNISSEGRRWVLKHKTPVTDHRHWKLFYNFMADGWKPDGKPPRTPDMKLGCHHGKYGAYLRGLDGGNAYKIWDINCVQRNSWESLQGRLDDEERSLDNLLDIRARRLAGKTPHPAVVTAEPASLPDASPPPVADVGRTPSVAPSFTVQVVFCVVASLLALWARRLCSRRQTAEAAEVAGGGVAAAAPDEEGEEAVAAVPKPEV